MSRRVIAVVDDEPGIRTLVGTYLNAAGYDAQAFPGGREFLDGHHPASGQRGCAESVHARTRRTGYAARNAGAWAYVVETDKGLRVRFDGDDWQRFGLGQGQRVPVRVAGKNDVWLFVTSVVETPPIVWVTLARRVRAAG